MGFGGVKKISIQEEELRWQRSMETLILSHPLNTARSQQAILNTQEIDEINTTTCITWATELSRYVVWRGELEERKATEGK